MKPIITTHQSWRTTICGVGLGLVTQWQAVGFKVPTSSQDWAATAGSVLLALLGWSARDAKVSQVEHAEEKELIADPPKIVEP